MSLSVSVSPLYVSPSLFVSLPLRLSLCVSLPLCLSPSTSLYVSLSLSISLSLYAPPPFPVCFVSVYELHASPSSLCTCSYTPKAHYIHSHHAHMYPPIYMERTQN